MPDQGEVEIILNGEAVILRCTLRAATTVNALGGGFVGVLRGIQGYDLNAFAGVIAAATGKKTSKEIEVIQEAVYLTGMEGLVAPLSRFVTMLTNGGREKSDEEVVDTGDAKKPKASG